MYIYIYGERVNLCKKWSPACPQDAEARQMHKENGLRFPGLGHCPASPQTRGVPEPPAPPGRDSRQLPELEQILLHGRAAAGPPLASLRAGMAGGGRERRGWTAPGPGQRREGAERTQRNGAERNGSTLLGTARLGSARLY